MRLLPKGRPRVKLHANAKLTPSSRLLLCRRIEEEGRSVTEAAEAAGADALAEDPALGAADVGDQSGPAHLGAALSCGFFDALGKISEHKRRRDETGESPVRSRHCNRGAAPRQPLSETDGKAGDRRGSGSQDTHAVVNTVTGTRNPEEVVMSDDVRSVNPRDVGFALPIPFRQLMPWMLLGVAVLGVPLFLLGMYQESTWLHEFLHDGRHLLGFPCH